MTQDDFVHFIGIVLYVLLPIIPAYLFYKYLPSEGSAKGPVTAGPLKLDVKFTGAFAGYVFIFVLLFFFAKPQHTPYHHQWTVKGRVAFEGSLLPQPNPENTTFFVRPPAPIIYPDGTFTMQIETSVPPTDASFPSLLLEYPGFHRTNVPLSQAQSKPKFGSKNYDIEIVKDTIDVKTPITLTNVGAKQ